MRILKSLLPIVLVILPLYHLKSQDTILVFHPTVSNIKTIATLTEGMLLPGKTQDFCFLGVFHSNEQYDYNKSKSFLSDNPDIKFNLYCINKPIDITEIYYENACSSDFQKLFKSSVGAIFLGGPDLPPAAYDADMHLLTSVTDPARHYLELSALFHFLGSNKNADFQEFMTSFPGYTILGICLGMQTLNVATGGTLIQDIPMEIYNFNTRGDVLSAPVLNHRNYTYDDPCDTIELTSYHFHPISFIGKTTFSKALEKKGKTPMVLSSHHQAIDQPGEDLLPVATSTDGKIIEAVVHQKYHRVTGVQFHPEKPNLYFESEDTFITPDSTLNNKAFIESDGSDKFHKDFWKMISEYFIDSSKEK